MIHLKTKHPGQREFSRRKQPLQPFFVIKYYNKNIIKLFKLWRVYEMEADAIRMFQKLRLIYNVPPSLDNNEDRVKFLSRKLR